MRKASFAIILVLTLSCSADSIVNPIDFPAGCKIEFVLKEGAEVTLMPERVAVVFLSPVEEGRCPTGVVCFWRGEAKIRLRISPFGQTGEERFVPCPDSDQTDIISPAQGYLIKFWRRWQKPNEVLP